MKATPYRGVSLYRFVRLCPLLALLVVSACSRTFPTGLIYTNIRLPRTANLHNTPVPAEPPGSARIFEIKEPITGYGLYAQVHTNAIGDIAREKGMQTLYFADQEIFSILGIYKTHRTILYGE